MRYAGRRHRGGGPDIRDPLTEFQVGAVASVVIPMDASWSGFLITDEAYAGFPLRT